MDRTHWAVMWGAVICYAMVGWTASSHAEAADAPRPNIIIMMADDMGWSDIGCYGGEIKTPTLDQLAAKGVRFTQFYNTGRCCPTRAALLTGLYPHQAGIGWMMSDQKLPGYQGDLKRNCRTIAEVLRPAGYRTYMSGKWHVTKKVRPNEPADKHNWPLQRGFDRFFGTIHGAGSFYDPNSLTRDNKLIVPDSKDFFYTDATADNAAMFIKDHKRDHADKPFFLYVSFTAPHWPMHARPHNIAKYKGKYDSGWDAMRTARYKRQLDMGLIDPAWKLAPRDPRAAAWDDSKNDADRAWHLRNMEVYAAMVDCMDQGIGRIVASLKETGQLDNTLILFLADNGGCAEGMGGNPGIRYRDNNGRDDLKPMGKDELQYDMIPKRTRTGVVLKQGRGVLSGPADTYNGYGVWWANASNTPFREYKHWVHEGGISSPLVAHWPKGIDASRHGQLESQPGHLIDLMATCVDLAGATYPKQVDGRAVTPMQGVSLRPALSGKPLGRKSPIFWEHEGNRAMRDGKWKLVAKGANGPWELYDIDADRTELNNLAEKEPERLKQMADAWEAWAVEALVKPWPWNNRGRRNRNAAAESFSKETQFTLKAGDALPREKAPMVANRAWAVNASIENATDGVVVAQGGSSLGWSLYIANGKPAVAVRSNGRLTVAVSKDKLPEGKVSLTASLSKRGKLTLTVNGKTAAKVDAGGPIPSMPLDGLDVGTDTAGLVGEYTQTDFKGKIIAAAVAVGK